MRKIFPPIAVLFMLSSHLSAISIDGYTVNTNDRFADDSSFVAQNLDLSGVGLSINGKWATLVSENVFVSANHFHPTIGGSVQFYAGNDPASNSITRTVSSGQRIGSTDIWVGVLDSPVSPNYAFYDISLTPNIGQNAYMLGRSPNSNTITQDLAVGRNILDSVAPSTAVGSSGDAILATYNSPVGGVTYESILRGGDSGAPLFTTDPVSGNTSLVGTNWIVAQLGFANTSGFTNLSADRNEIQNIIAANAVPEPSSAILFSLGSLMLISRRKR